MPSVFLSYAREDSSAAERLYMDLRRSEIDVWMDKKSLLPGHDWEHEIRRAIREARYFLALASKTSVAKRGFVQREMRFALEVLEEVPIDQIYLIPVRLDDCEPPDFRVKAINRVDLFPSYRKGLERLLAAIGELEKHPVLALDPRLAVAHRAPIEFTPFRSFNDFVRLVLAQLPEQAHFHDREISYFITYDTTHPEVVLPEHVKAKYPQTITIVLRAGFLDLLPGDRAVSVTVQFADQLEAIRIPYSSIKKIVVPEIDLLIARLDAKPGA
jgi:hypothetical protein